MRRAIALSLAFFVVADPLGATDGAPDRVAAAFGRALVAGRASELRTALPSTGKVRIVLDRLGPLSGDFGAGQAEALFAEVLRHTTFRRWEPVRSETGSGAIAFVRARAEIVDGAGHVTTIAFRLTLQPELAGWVVREVRESDE